MPYVNYLLTQIIAEVAKLTAAIFAIPTGGGGGGGSYTPKVKAFNDQSGVVSGQLYQHNFQSGLGLLPTSYRLRVQGWDTDNYEILGIRTVPVDGDNARIYFDDTTTPFSGDIQFYITTPA